MDDQEHRQDGPTGPDHGPRAGTRRRGADQDLWQVVLVVAIGGALGACARYGAALIWPTAPGSFPWTTFGVNAVGCALMGVLMALITDLWTPHRLVRPFFGTGVLGGFTTFSTYTVDIERLLDGGRAPVALAYLGLTLAAALAAVGSAAAATRRAVAWRRS